MVVGRKYCGHRRSSITTLSPHAYTQIPFLLQHFYFARLDKASNNVCVLCIKHICLQALARLEEADFVACISGLDPQPLHEIISNITTSLDEYVIT